MLVDSGAAAAAALPESGTILGSDEASGAKATEKSDTRAPTLSEVGREGKEGEETHLARGRMIHLKCLLLFTVVRINHRIETWYKYECE